MRSRIATVALMAISISSPVSAQFANTKWGMQLAEVQKLFPGGDVIAGRGGGTIYTTRASPQGLPDCNTVFDFDPAGGLAEVNLYFVSTRSDTNPAKQLSLLRRHLVRKHGPLTSEHGASAFWLLPSGDTVLLTVAPSLDGTMVPGIVYAPMSADKGYAPSEHAGYDKTTWGMPAEKVRRIYSNGILEKQENGRLQYRVVLPVGPADSGLVFFDFDDHRQLSSVSIMFPEQGMPIDLRSTTITRPTKEHGEQLFENLRVEMIKKYGRPNTLDGKFVWLTQHGDAITLILLVESGFATPSLMYQPAGADRTRGL